MIALYQSTFFLALALLAIVITLFVLAVSLLGRAVKISIEEQQKSEKERQKYNQEQLTKIQDQLEEAREDSKHPDIVEDLASSLHDLKEQAKIQKRKLTWIRWKPKFLQVCWGVFIPAALFTFSIILSALAAYFQTSANISLSLWILSLITMLSGITLICLTLKVIEGVAVTSEDISFVKQKDALKTALLESEEEKKPELSLTFDAKLPITIGASSQESISFNIRLAKGDIGRRPQVMFFAPKGFEFPGQRTTVQPDSLQDVGGLLTAYVDFKDCRRGVTNPHTIVIKAPSEKGTYDLWYNVICEQFVGSNVKFKVRVN